jgi:hypothetical protein
MLLEEMTAHGQTRRFRDVRITSGLSPTDFDELCNL